MSKPYIDYQFELIVREWSHVQTHITHFDLISFSIRGWSVSLFTAIMAIAFAQKDLRLILATVVPMVMFWLIDGVFRGFQLQAIDRAWNLETYLASDAFQDDIRRGEILHLHAPALGETYRSQNRWQVVRRGILTWHVALTYLLLIAASLVCYTLASRGIL